MKSTCYVVFRKRIYTTIKIHYFIPDIENNYHIENKLKKHRNPTEFLKLFFRKVNKKVKSKAKKIVETNISRREIV